MFARMASTLPTSSHVLPWLVGRSLWVGPLLVFQLLSRSEPLVQSGLFPLETFSIEREHGAPRPSIQGYRPPLSVLSCEESVLEDGHFDPLPTSSLTQSTSEKKTGVLSSPLVLDPQDTPHGSRFPMVGSVHYPQRIEALSGGTCPTSRQIAARIATKARRRCARVALRDVACEPPRRCLRVGEARRQHHPHLPVRGGTRALPCRCS